jgi:hypothetical protein
MTLPRNVQDCIGVAAAFMAAEPGGAQRVLGVHRRQPDGWCSGCIYRPVRWPCPAAHIALHAARIQEATGAPAGHDRRRR